MSKLLERASAQLKTLTANLSILFGNHKYANNLELEKLVDLAIQICFYPKAEITDTGISAD